MGGGYDIGLSASTSSAAQTGAIGFGGFGFNFGNNGGRGNAGGLASVLPSVSGNQAWIAWLVVGGVVAFALWAWSKRK